MSPIDELLRPLLALPPAERMAALDAALDGCQPSELVAFVADFAGTWARAEQLPPEGDAWRTWGFCTGRGYGKTRSLSEYVTEEARAGRAMRIALIAQTEDKTLDVMVHGEAGLLAVSKPDFRAVYENRRVLWPNGAQAFVYTPHEPENLRGPEHHLAWCSEFVAWPPTTREQALDMLEHGLRLGYARMVWDSTPKRRHPIIRQLLARAEENPCKHVVVRGSTHANAINLARGRVEELVKKYGGTQKGREEIGGEYLDDDEGALWKQAWIDDNRRDMPSALARRVLSIDPAISDRKGTDDTGISDLGLGHDEQVYVIADLTARIGWDEWGELIVSRYFAQRCDMVIVERNRGGDACVGNLRAAARSRVAALRKLGVATLDIEVVVLDPKESWRPHKAGKIWVREVIGRESKGARAAPVASEYEGGRVSHVIGAMLLQLEDTMTTWEPEKSTESPNAIDAMVHGVWELARLADSKPDGRRAMRGIEKIQAALCAPVAAPRIDGEISGARAALGMLAPSEWGSKI